MQKITFVFLFFIVLGFISCKTDIDSPSQKDIESSVQKFTVRFDSDGGSKINLQEITKGTVIQKPEDPAKDDYVFCGWFLDGSLFDFSTPITSDITLKAKWNKKSFIVTFDSDDGSEVTFQIIEVKNTVMKPVTPTKDGYVFLGWYIAESMFDFSTPITSNITLKAKWDIQSSQTIPEEQKTFFIVAFDSDGGNSILSQKIETGKVAINPEKPVRDGYDFKGWFLGDTLFDFSIPISSNITLYAKWTEHSSPVITEEEKLFFSVTFDTNGGSEIVSQEVENGKTVTRPEDPLKDGYDFKGWFLGDTLFDFSIPISSNITLYAKWTEHSFPVITEEEKQFFSVTFDTNGGSEIVSQEIENGKTVSRPEDPYRERYCFIGWFIGENKFDFSTPITSDLTLKAKWEQTIFVVTFDFDGVRDNVEKRIEKGKLVETENAAWTNHKFQGWFYDDTLFDFSTPITIDITLKAKWIKICNVTLEYENGQQILKEVNEGELIERPSDPTKENCTFAGWFYEGSRFNFLTPITSNITLVARWYVDIAEGEAYKSSIPNEFKYTLLIRKNDESVRFKSKQGTWTFSIEVSPYFKNDTEMKFNGTVNGKIDEETYGFDYNFTITKIDSWPLTLTATRNYGNYSIEAITISKSSSEPCEVTVRINYF